MSFISWLIILFTGFLYLALRISETIEKQRQAQMLQLNLPAITADIEQVIEESATVSGQKLLLIVATFDFCKVAMTIVLTLLVFLLCYLRSLLMKKKKAISNKSF